MPKTAITFGVLLILLGLGAFGYAFSTLPPGEPASRVVTALIPAIFGVLLALLGFAASAMENLRKHLMHGAVLIGLLGFLGTVSSVLKLPALFAGTAERPAAVVVQFITAMLCVIFVALCVKSFIDARRAGTV
ncbi:MAG: hypothetical protein QUS14_18530 [Pyrinomonadaceae bacterium]|jgi:peptidoglycan/LPS O-acetylase OafA/YrhL|nr:hypothetical protein [Pyrinomonadaceae bacterium]